MNARKYTTTRVRKSLIQDWKLLEVSTIQNFEPLESSFGLSLQKGTVEKVKVRELDLREHHALRRARFFRGIVMRPPLLPRLRIIPKRFFRDKPERTVNPSARVGIQRIIIQKIQEIRHRCKSLFMCEHAGLGD